MALTQMVAFAVVAAVLAVFLKESHPAMAMLLAGVASAMLLLKILFAVYTPLQSFCRALLKCGVESTAVTYLLKTLGVCYLTRFCCELCCDFGQSALAAKVELAGRAAVFLLSIPLVQQVLHTALSLI